MKYSLIIALIVFSFSCEAQKKAPKAPRSKDDNKIDVVFMQINDVYEITPVSGGKEGGLARVASLKKELYAKNSNTFLVISGDFVSPSVYNTLEYQGKKIRGAQMIDALNSAGTDFATFGNHEFDLKESELQDRINESGFNWISSNVLHRTAEGDVPFKRNTTADAPPFPSTLIMTVKDKDSTTAKIGFIGLTLNSNQADYVSYKDPFAAATEAYNRIKDSVDAVIAITHQSIQDDIKLAKQLPKLAAILGGHEHGMEYAKIGKVYITKAHANARSAYVVTLHINKKKKSVQVSPELQKLDESIPLDSNTNFIVQKWKKIATDNYATLGFDANKVVIEAGDPLDGRETETRTSSTNLTKLIGKAMAYACPDADVTIYNSGSIRLDDVLIPPVTEYDIIRTLPFGGGMREVEMKGDLLLQILEAGKNNRGSGGYLQSEPSIYDAGSSFLLGNTPIEASQYYKVAISDFLFSGKEANLSFLNEKNPRIRKVYPAETDKNSPKSDIRLAVIKYLLNE